MFGLPGILMRPGMNFENVYRIISKPLRYKDGVTDIPKKYEREY